MEEPQSDDDETTVEFEIEVVSFSSHSPSASPSRSSLVDEELDEQKTSDEIDKLTLVEECDEHQDEDHLKSHQDDGKQIVTQIEVQRINTKQTNEDDTPSSCTNDNVVVLSEKISDNGEQGPTGDDDNNTTNDNIEEEQQSIPVESNDAAQGAFENDSLCARESSPISTADLSVDEAPQIEEPQGNELVEVQQTPLPELESIPICQTIEIESDANDQRVEPLAHATPDRCDAQLVIETSLQLPDGWSLHNSELAESVVKLSACCACDAELQEIATVEIEQTNETIDKHVDCTTLNLLQLDEQLEQQQQQISESANFSPPIFYDLVTKIEIAKEKVSDEEEEEYHNIENVVQYNCCYEEEDLEREFDEEPEFERRNVVVKRNLCLRDEYELGAELGRGKFGTVVRCTERASGRQLAAKFIHMRRKEDREDVEREVAIMCVLQHKRLLQLYDAFDDNQHEMCLITELIEGGELFERIVNDDFDLTEKVAAIFMRQICEGVEYMHSENIVHLDMKPENILCVSRTGNRIKLIDFGLARRIDPTKPIRVMFGTPDFAAPETLAYDNITLATDMWSVGVICYVLLSGLSPFMGDNDLDTMANVLRATYDFDDKAFEPITDLAKDFIAKLLIREPDKRLKPSECLQHAWLQRGGSLLEAAVRERRESSAAAAAAMATTSALLTANADDSEQVAAAVARAAELTPTARMSGSFSSSHHNPQQQQLLHYQRRSFGGESTASGGLISLDKRRLKKYVVRRKWHKTVHAIMALGRMGANLKL